MGLLLSVLVLWGSTLGIVALDKSQRARKLQESGEDPAFMAEASWGTIIALCILLNLVTLPYYFWSTRRSALWGLVGFFAFGLCLTLMIVVQIVAR